MVGVCPPNPDMLGYVCIWVLHLKYSVQPLFFPFE